MSENEKPKKPRATEIIAKLPRRDNNGPDKGGGNPHMNPDEKSARRVGNMEVPRITKAAEEVRA